MSCAIGRTELLDELVPGNDGRPPGGEAAIEDERDEVPGLGAVVKPAKQYERLGYRMAAEERPEVWVEVEAVPATDEEKLRGDPAGRGADGIAALLGEEDLLERVHLEPGRLELGLEGNRDRQAAEPANPLADYCVLPAALVEAEGTEVLGESVESDEAVVKGAGLDPSQKPSVGTEGERDAFLDRGVGHAQSGLPTQAGDPTDGSLLRIGPRQGAEDQVERLNQAV